MQWVKRDLGGAAEGEADYVPLVAVEGRPTRKNNVPEEKKG
jgi:hypothetical protein